MLCEEFCFSSCCRFVQDSRTDCAILPEGLKLKNIVVKLFCIWISVSGKKCHLKIFLVYSSDSQLVWRSKTIQAISEEDIMRNISINLFCIWTRAVGIILRVCVVVLSKQGSLSTSP